jgi:cytidyltransferase-like protein
MSVPIVRTLAELRATVAAWRKDGAKIAVVPTMGALHEGHLSLVRAALARAERVIVTLFVNPKQFNSAADLAAYPRTEDSDAAKLSPHEQVTTAFGLLTLKPPCWRSSEKSSSLPLTNSALLGSITTFTPLLGTMMSRSRGPSTRSILYCNPEQPPPTTAMRSAPSGLPCLSRMPRKCAAAGVSTRTSFSLPIL